MSEINSVGKPPAHDVMNACDYLVLHNKRFLTASQGNAIRLIRERMKERGVSKDYDGTTLRKYAKMYRTAARILGESSSKEDVGWLAKNMTNASREREYLQKAINLLND